MNLRRLRYVLLAYALCDFLIGYAGIFPIQNLAAAQFTTVTGTVTDPNGLPYSFGTITPILVVPSGAGSPTLNGQSYFPPSQATGLAMNGSFTVTLADNTVLLPAATKWNFQVCSGAGSVQPAFGKGPVCFSLAAPITISGTSQDISANLNAVALALTFAAGCAQGVCIVNNPTADQTITGAHTLFMSDPGAVIGLGTTTVTGAAYIETHSAFSNGLDIYIHSSTNPLFRGPTIDFWKSRGTQALPTAVQFDDPLMKLNGGGYDGTAYTPQGNGTAQIFARAFENWDGTHHGTVIRMISVRNTSIIPSGVFMQLGGSSNQYPALIVDTTGGPAHFRLADDSGDANVLAANVKGSTLQGTVGAFASLATCNGGTEGSLGAVNDSTTAVWGATITGGGANHVLAYCDGTNWTVSAK